MKERSRHSLLLSRQLLLPSLFFSATEAALVAGALILFDLDAAATPPVLAAAAGAYLLTAGGWTLLSALFLRPVKAAVRQLDGGPAVPADTLTRSRTVLDRFPDLTVLARAMIWATTAAAGCLVGGKFSGLDLGRSLSVISIALSSATAVLCFRRIWLGNCTERLLATITGRDALECPQAGNRLFGRLVWMALACGAAGLVAVMWFSAVFIAPPGESMVRLASYLPLTVVLLTFAWLYVAARFFRPVGRYLDAKDTLKVELAPAAFRTAQALPYLLAASKVLFWLVGALLLLLEAVRLFGVDDEHATLILAAALIITLATVLYEALWHRRALNPLLTLLTNRHRLPAGHIRSPVSLRVKMVVGFGVLAVFSCAAAVFLSYVQYRNLATDFIQKQARLGADLVLDRLRTQVKLQRNLTAHDIAGLLKELSSGQQAVCYHLPPAGRAFAIGGTTGEPPSLPFRARTRMRVQNRGLLTLSELKLAGAFVRIRLAGKDYGSVAVLYPDYRGAGPGVARQIKLLLLFFTALLILSAGIVVLIVADLTGPLKVLEQRVDEMARGDLHRPVPGGGEADEVGRLTFAFEGLRRSLDEKLRTIQELNLGLEKKVQARTADLARANEELLKALDTLTRTQDQLVRSEKLASIGQLVAGVAHELNNPINAVINSVEPLERSLGNLVKAADPAARDIGVAAQTAEEIKEILRVITSGARRTQKIVSALSSYSRTDDERAVPTDVKAALDEALQITTHLTGPYTLERDVEADIRVEARPGQLEQVFVNLIANAAQALASRTDGRIRIQTKKDQNEVSVRIEDNGPGIPEDALSRIFDPFFTTKEVGQGTGLGLSICHEIVSRHGGRIEVESRVDQGAAFTVVLPAGKPESA